LIKKYFNIAEKKCIDEYNDLFYYQKKETLEVFDFVNDENCQIIRSHNFISFPFKSFAEKFKYIDDCSINIIILNDITKDLLEKLNFVDNIKIRRILSQHSVSIYQQDFDALNEINVISKIKDVFYLNNEIYYNNNEGLKLLNNSVDDYLNL